MAYLKPDEEQHIYHIPEINKDLPSVTTCISLFDKSGALMGWSVKMMGEYLLTQIRKNIPITEDVVLIAKKEYRNISQEAMDIGSEVHNLLEVYLKEQPYQSLLNERTQKPFDAFLLWEREHNFKCIKSEHIVWSELNGYAGTLDAVGFVDGKKCVLDFKSSSAIWDTHLWQISAYKEAYEYISGESVEGLGILRLDKKTGMPEWKSYTLAEGKDAFEKFMCLCRLWHLLDKDKKKKERK